MTTTRSATKIWLIGSSKSQLNTSCLPTNGDVMRYFFHIFKNQNETATNAVKQGYSTKFKTGPDTKDKNSVGSVKKKRCSPQNGTRVVPGFN